MLIAILVSDIVIICELAIIIYNTWHRKVKTGGWIKPTEEPVFDDDDDNIVPLTEKREADWMEEHNQG